MSLTCYYLPLYGTAHIEKDGEVLSIRKKSLAILYFLALEGITRREYLAELLWSHDKGGANLRAEIYYLRKKLGLDITAHSGMLALPSCVSLDASSQGGEPLEGLENISADFDAWITSKRFELEYEQHPKLTQQLARQLASKLPLPGLWILAGPIGTGKRRLALALAEELNLTFREGWKPSSAGMIYIDEPLPTFTELEKPLDWPQALVVAKPAFGEEPSLLLGLRSVYPAERTRFLEMPKLNFVETNILLNNFSFFDAARYYLRSHGRDELLEEMVRANHEMPLKYRAKYKLESRRLRRNNRLVLERISVCPETINSELAHRMGNSSDLEELERRGWLVYHDGWRFADPVARRALEHDLPQGLKIQYHQRAASAWERTGKYMLAAWHRLQSGESVNLMAAAKRSGDFYAKTILSESDQDPPITRLSKGNLIPLLETRRLGEGLERHENFWLILRPEYAGQPAWLEFEPLDKDAIIQVSGQLWVFAPLSGALQGRAPLVFQLGKRRFSLAPAKAAQQIPGGWLLPTLGDFNYFFYLPAKTPVAITCGNDEMAAKIDIQAFTISAGKHVISVYK